MTIKELARKLNLSITTVSRVLNGQSKKYRISKKTEQLVKAFAKEHGYSPNTIARNLRMQKTDTIGLVIPDISNPFFANLAKTLELELRKNNKLILLCDTHEDSDIEKESLKLLMDRKVDGLLIAPVGLQSKFLDKINIPTILIDRYFDDLKLPYVSTNNFEGAYMATNYLIERGHKKIACIQGLKNTISNQERVRGFQQAMLDAQLLEDTFPILGENFNRSSGFNACKKLLNNGAKPSAIFTLGNQIALGAIQALKEMKLQIPTDVSLISFDEHIYFHLTQPPITTICQPVEQIAQEAVLMLLKIMEGKEVNSQLIHSEMIERESVSFV